LCDAYAQEAAHHDVKVVYIALGHRDGQRQLAVRLLSRFDPRDIGCIYDPGNMCVEATRTIGSASVCCGLRRACTEKRAVCPA
jgi:hypothetical protein